jgi:hypothetical protein
MFTDWPKLLGLTSLRAVELVCLCFFLAPLEKRKYGIGVMALQIAGFAALSILVRQLIYQLDWEREFFYISFAYYPIVLGFIMARYAISIKEGINFLLLFFLSIHEVRPLVMRVGVLVYGVNFLTDYSRPLFSLLLMALLAAVLLLEFFVLKKYAFRYPKYKLTWSQLGVTIIATIPVVYISNLFLILNTDSTNIPVSVMLIGVVCSFCGMMIVIGYKNTLALARNRQEMVALEALLASQQKQYQLKKETIELINARYHDLKKHIIYLASIASQKEREKYLETFKLQVSAYEAFHDTGNETLDIVLTDKDMECRNNGTRLLLFVDGKLLEFLQPLDMVTIFCNAIDNSIEAVKKLPDEDRAITVRMHEHDTWLVVTFENTFAGELKWKDNRLASTKEDGGEHGFGLINIENAVEKYHGNVTVDIQGTQFILKILFPKR